MKKNTTLIVFCLCILLSSKNTFGFVFGEHKKIGDAAFRRFINSDPRIRTFFSDVLFNSDNHYPLIINGNYYVLMPSDQMLGGITYGDMTGMLADHAENPILLFQEFMRLDISKWLMDRKDSIAVTQKSILIQVLLLHHYAIENGKKAASDISLQLKQPNYAMLATEDSSHFYRLGLRTKQEQLAIGAKEYLSDTVHGNSILQYFEAKFDTLNDAGEQQFNDSILKLLFKKMEGLNAISKYAILHTIALDMMDVAAFTVSHNGGILSREVKNLIILALLFNANADHYLEDSFAAGHLAVARSATRALKNKGTHDYYNRIGLLVSNDRDNDSWMSYGDGFLYYTSTDFQYAVDANTASLMELWNRYNSDINIYTLDSNIYINIIAQLSAQPVDTVVDYFMNTFSALRIIPHPIDPSIVKFTNSRNGGYSTFTVDYYGGGHLNQAGINYGKGMCIIKPDTLAKWRESNLWLGLVNIGLNYSNITTPILMSSVSILEANFYNIFTIGPGSFYHYWSSHARFIEYYPYIGIEFKPICSGFSPAVRYTLPANSDQKSFLSFQVRYYFK